MSTYLFAWNPSNWSWDRLPIALEQIASTGHTTEWWSCQSHRAVRPGDRAFLVRLGVPDRGIMGSGYVLTESFLAPHWRDKNKLVPRVDIEFDVLIDPESGNTLPLSTFDSPPLNTQTWTPQASGISISSEIAKHLEKVWFDHVESLTYGTTGSLDVTKLTSLWEGGKKRVSSIRYERNPHARLVCIEHYGTKCVICGVDFGQVYGHLGEGFIHVHHIDPVSAAGESRPIDPIRDLRPVCPNCHAMLHRKSPPISIEFLRELIE